MYLKNSQFKKAAKLRDLTQSSSVYQECFLSGLCFLPFALGSISTSTSTTSTTISTPSYLLAVSEGFKSWPFHLILCDLQKKTCHLWASVSFYRNDTSSWEIIIFMWEMHEIPSACHALNVIFIITCFSMCIAFITFYPFMMPLVMYFYLWQLLVILILKIKQFKI